jgi:lipopolysaccharide export LptBFGC system permease protein LptF
MNAELFYWIVALIALIGFPLYVIFISYSFYRTMRSGISVVTILLGALFYVAISIFTQNM